MEDQKLDARFSSDRASIGNDWPVKFNTAKNILVTSFNQVDHELHMMDGCSLYEATWFERLLRSKSSPDLRWKIFHCTAQVSIWLVLRYIICTRDRSCQKWSIAAVFPLGCSVLIFLPWCVQKLLSVLVSNELFSSLQLLFHKRNFVSDVIAHR